MQKIIAGIWHLVPILPLVGGHYFGFVAALCFVALPYIKVKKMDFQIAELSDPAHKQEIAAARNRWKFLTLLTL